MNGVRVGGWILSQATEILLKASEAANPDKKEVSALAQVVCGVVVGACFRKGEMKRARFREELASG